MTNPVAWLFDTAPFLTRSHCGVGWSGTLQATYVLANLTVAFTYFAILAQLSVLYRSKRQDLPQPLALVLLGSFFFFCGLTHLSDVLVFRWAPYRLYTLIFSTLAVLSLCTTLYLPVAIRRIVLMPSRNYVHKLLNDLQCESLLREVAIQQKEAMIRDLQRELGNAQVALRSQEWTHEKGQALDRIEAALQLLKTGGG